MTVNAPFGHRAGLRTGGRVRYLGWAVPEAVYVDFDVIASAPAGTQPQRRRRHPLLPHRPPRLAAGPRHWAGRSRAGRTTSGWWPRPGSGSTPCSGALDDIRDVTEEGIRTLMLAHRWGGADVPRLRLEPAPHRGRRPLLLLQPRAADRPALHPRPAGRARASTSARCCRTTSRARCWRPCTGPASTSGPRRWASPGTTRRGDADAARVRARGRAVVHRRRRPARWTTTFVAGSATASRPPTGPGRRRA